MKRAPAPAPLPAAASLLVPGMMPPAITSPFAVAAAEGPALSPPAGGVTLHPAASSAPPSSDPAVPAVCAAMAGDFAAAVAACRGGAADGGQALARKLDGLAPKLATLYARVGEGAVDPAAVAGFAALAALLARGDAPAAEQYYRAFAPTCAADEVAGALLAVKTLISCVAKAKAAA
jgi:hypothetical protein